MHPQAFPCLRVFAPSRGTVFKNLTRCVALSLLAAPAAFAQTISVTPVGPFTLPAGTTGATGLSGITYADGSQYYAVGDNVAGLFPLDIQLNSTTGAITSATLSPKIQLTGHDLEGVAYNPTDHTVFVSDETGPAIRQHNVVTGAEVGSIPVPGIYNSIRSNLSLESLTRQPGTGVMWTANEEALTVDGLRSTVTAGTFVRIQKFTPAGDPAGQWAYLTDSITADSPLTTAERSGVSDLLALPDGKLLVLERELGGSFVPTLRNRLYLLDFTSATDVANFASLAAGGFTAVAKTQLWQGDFPLDNFEGITLGPDLGNGDHSLILISDNGSGLNQSLYTLRLTAVPEPTTATSLLGAGGTLLLKRKRPARYVYHKGS